MEGSTELKVIKAKAVSATPENFKAFGQVTGPSPDGTLFSSDDAQLSLHAGIPREADALPTLFCSKFYVMLSIVF
ncbi:hypothetical protein SUGI_1059010 [Cryptomeria japonica]|nr:hypothetical protein SUGI_1059010 [Cryptomeria japonica]